MESISNMSQDSWDNFLKEWDESLEGDIYLSPKPVKTEKRETKEKDVRSYLYIERTTKKATFYMTEDGIAGRFGFWVPNSAIIKDDTSKKEVKLAPWCGISIIEFN